MENTQQADELFDTAIRECEKFQGVVVGELGKLLIASKRSRLAMLFLSAALDHFRAVIHLLDDGRYASSAFALVRPIADATFRAIWVAHIATNDQIEAKLTNEKSEYPPLKEIFRLMDKKFDSNDEGVNELLKDEYSALCGHVHTGLRQLRSRVAARRTKSFPYKNALAMLGKSSSYLSLGACYFATSIQQLKVAIRIEKAHDSLCEKIGTNQEIRQGKTLWVN